MVELILKLCRSSDHVGDNDMGLQPAPLTLVLRTDRSEAWRTTILKYPQNNIGIVERGLGSFS